MLFFSLPNKRLFTIFHIGQDSVRLSYTHKTHMEIEQHSVRIFHTSPTYPYLPQTNKKSDYTTNEQLLIKLFHIANTD